MQQLFDSIMEKLDQLNYIKPEEIPSIDLYMDQVLTFLNDRLQQTARNEKEDKLLTKTMINNYAKNDLIPPPVKKKYSRDHIFLLIFIYYFKGVISINDTGNLLNNVTRDYFGKSTARSPVDREKAQQLNDLTLEDIYNEVFQLEKPQIERLKQDIAEKFKLAETTFTTAPRENQDFLQRFAVICLLSFDVYVKKMMIESLIDDSCPPQERKK
jgi:hypothetical protein